MTDIDINELIDEQLLHSIKTRVAKQQTTYQEDLINDVKFMAAIAPNAFGDLTSIPIHRCLWDLKERGLVYCYDYHWFAYPE